MSDDKLRELGKQLPYDRPDAERRETVRSSLLVAATQATDSSLSRKRWLLVGGGFAAGALAAAAIAIVVIRPTTSPDRTMREAHARVDAPATAKLEHTVSATATGTDEVVRVRAGVVRVAVPEIKRGDRVRMQTADAEVEGTGTYEVAVVDDRLERVTVEEGSAHVNVRIDGQPRQIVLAAGQTWRPTVITADLDIAPPAPPAPTSPAPPTVEASQDGASKDEASKVGASKVEASKVEASRVGAGASKDEAPKVGVSRVPASVEASQVATSTPSPSAATPASTSVAAKADAPKSSEVVAKIDETTRNEQLPAMPAMPAVTTLESSKPAGGKRTPSPTELHFQKGWTLLRDGKPREAAAELAIAADASASDPLAADARYFQAIALVRAGQIGEAERVLVAFLDRAPQSLRRGRAAILLGRLLRDRGDAKSARAWFESALTDSDPAIVDAAKAHIAALSTR